jgi:preprotein translocase SecE subunit
VARDRQRAKQRRAKRQPGAGGPAAGSASTNARDIGLDQADADDAGLGNTAPPEPTKHAMPNVEEARMAEAGPARIDEEAVPGDDDQVEGDLVPSRSRDTDRAREEAAHAGRPRKRRGRALTFIGHSIDELRRVQWPDRRQVSQGTAVTLGFVVLAGGYLGLLDALWKPLIEAIL